MDMTESIAPKSDQMNAEDLLSGPRTFTITEVRRGSAEQPVDILVAEHPQPFKPSKTVRRILVNAWGADTATYIGRRMTLYRDPAVRFGGLDVGGIRVSHLSHIEKRLTVALTVTRGKRAPYVVEPLREPVQQQAPELTDAMIACSTDVDQLKGWWRQHEGRRADIEARVADLQADPEAGLVMDGATS